MNRQRISARAKLFVKSFGKRHRTPFCFDERKVAIICSNASHHAAQKWRRTRRKLLKQRLGQQATDGVCGNVGNNRVLRGGETNLAVAVDFREPGEFVQMIGIDAARGNAKTYGAEPLLFLRTDPKVVGMRGAAHIPSLKRELMPKP